MDGSFIFQCFSMNRTENPYLRGMAAGDPAKQAWITTRPLKKWFGDGRMSGIQSSTNRKEQNR